MNLKNSGNLKSWFIYIGTSNNMVKANELLKIWLKSCDISLKFVNLNVLGTLYLFNGLFSTIAFLEVL